MLAMAAARYLGLQSSQKPPKQQHQGQEAGQEHQQEEVVVVVKKMGLHSSTKVAAAAMVGMKQQDAEPPPLPTYPLGKIVASDTMIVLTYMKKNRRSRTRATIRHSFAILPCASFSLSLVMYVRKIRLISRISLSIA